MHEARDNAPRNITPARAWSLTLPAWAQSPRPEQQRPRRRLSKRTVALRLRPHRRRAASPAPGRHA